MDMADSDIWAEWVMTESSRGMALGHIFATLSSPFPTTTVGSFIPALVRTMKLEQHPESPEHPTIYVCYLAHISLRSAPS